MDIGIRGYVSIGLHTLDSCSISSSGTMGTRSWTACFSVLLLFPFVIDAARSVEPLMNEGVKQRVPEFWQDLSNLNNHQKLRARSLLSVDVEADPSPEFWQDQENLNERQKLRARSLLSTNVETEPSPWTPPITTPFDSSLVNVATDLPFDHPRITKKQPGCDAAEQVHLTFWSATSVLVSWVTCDARTGPDVTGPQPDPGNTSLKFWLDEADCDKAKAYAANVENAAEVQARKHKRSAKKHPHTDNSPSYKHSKGRKDSSSDEDHGYDHPEHKQRPSKDDSSDDGYQGTHNHAPYKSKAPSKAGSGYAPSQPDYRKDKYDDQVSDPYEGYDDDKHTTDSDSYLREKFDAYKAPKVPKDSDDYKKHDDYKAPKDSDDYKKYDDYKGPKPPSDNDYHHKPDYGSDGDYQAPPCWARKTAQGVTTTYFNNYGAAGWPNANYASGVIHHVLLKDLVPGAHYFYTVTGGKTYDFTVPAHGDNAFPLRVGVLADPGETFNTSVIVDRLVEEKPDLVALIGDFCYADNWYNWTAPASVTGIRMTWQPKWDAWGRLFEPLLSKIPFMHVNGNHEIEQQPDGSRFRSYNHRYPVPQTKARRNQGPTVFPDVTASSAWENLYWSVDVPGAFKAIYLTSYSPDQPMEDWEEQYTWLENELHKVNRHMTPWLMVNWHAPWYNTYAAHYKENEAMRQAYESLLIKYQVDIVFNGHVHAYERKTPIVNNEVNKCGPVSITIGDGGNTEGLYRDFIETRVPQPTYCADAKANANRIFPSYQPQQKFLYETDPARCKDGETGCFCYGSQPDWSAYREPSFGYGMLEFQSPARAVWTWHSNQKDRSFVADKVTIIRNPLQCPVAREY